MNVFFTYKINNIQNKEIENMAKISVQLYSVKDATKEDFIGTLKKIAEIGYQGVEFAGYGDIPATEMKKVLDELGLEASGAHIGIDELKNNLDYHIEYNKIIGNKYLICPWGNTDTVEQVEQLKKDMEEICEKSARKGMVVGYHNHNQEFNTFDGKYAFDTILSGDDRIVYELDCYWSEYAGVDTLCYLKKIGKRCPLVHLKDMCILQDGTKDCSIFGDGVMDYKTIIKTANDACNPEWYVIEWEAFNMDCIQAVKESFINYEKLI